MPIHLAGLRLKPGRRDDAGLAGFDGIVRAIAVRPDAGQLTVD
jgi:hypothetical protein